MEKIEVREYEVEDKRGVVTLSGSKDLEKFYELLENNTNFIIKFADGSSRLIIADTILPAIKNGDIELRAEAGDEEE